MATAVVIGGGVSGLSAAFYLQKHLPAFKKVIVLEASSRFGGWVHTTINPDGAIYEHGPRSIRPVGEQGRNTLALVEELGLSHDVLPVPRSHPSAKNRYLYVDDKLCALPNTMSGMFKKTAPFSKPLAFQTMLEPLKPRCKHEDESIHSFVSRRTSREIADLAVDAMCRGIFAGDCRNLSMAACMPPVHRMEKDYGSILLAAAFSPKAKPEELSDGLVKRAVDEKWSTWSLRYGLQQLTDGLAKSVRDTPSGEVRVCAPVRGIAHDSSTGKTVVKTDQEDIQANLVISSIYSKDLSPLLGSELTEVKEQLSMLDSVDVVVVNLEFSGNVLPVQGFGHLLPSREGGPLLGVVYDSCPFPQHNSHTSPDNTRLTVMMGGAWYNDLLTSDNQLPEGRELVSMASEAVRKHLSIRSHPIRSHVSLQKKCIPQYRVGHLSWISSLEESLAKSGLPLVLVGSSYRGPAVNDCINNTRKSIMALEAQFPS